MKVFMIFDRDAYNSLFVTTAFPTREAAEEHMTTYYPDMSYSVEIREVDLVCM